MQSSSAFLTMAGSGPLKYTVSSVSKVGQQAYSRHMQKHFLIGFSACRVLKKAGSLAFYLHPAAGLRLNVLHVYSALADHLSSQIEAWNRVETNRNFFLWPFSLRAVSKNSQSAHLVRHLLRTRPNSSRSTCSCSFRRNLRSSTSGGRSCFMSSSILATAISRPRFVVLVTWRYSGGFFVMLASAPQHQRSPGTKLTAGVAMLLSG